MLKWLKDKAGKKEGAMTLLYVFLIFIALLVVIGFYDILIRSYTIDEIQSNMDMAGVSALQTSVDETHLRVGEFVIDEHVAKGTFRATLTNTMNGADKILSYRFINSEVELYKDTFGLGQTSKSREQALIDSTIVIVVESSQIFDVVPGAYDTYYNSRDNAYFDVTYLGKTDDGKVELSVRSVSRVVYR